MGKPHSHRLRALLAAAGLLAACGGPVDLGPDTVELTTDESGRRVLRADTAEVISTAPIILTEGNRVQVRNAPAPIDIMGLHLISGTVQIVDGTPRLQSDGLIEVADLCRDARDAPVPVRAEIRVAPHPREAETLVTAHLKLPDQAVTCHADLDGEDLTFTAAEGRVTGVVYEPESVKIGARFVASHNGEVALVVLSQSAIEGPPGLRFALASGGVTLYAQDPDFSVGYLSWEAPAEE